MWFSVSNFFFKVMCVLCYMSSDEKEVENAMGQADRASSKFSD